MTKAHLPPESLRRLDGLYETSFEVRDLLAEREEVGVPGTRNAIDDRISRLLKEHNQSEDHKRAVARIPNWISQETYVQLRKIAVRGGCKPLGPTHLLHLARLVEPADQLHYAKQFVDGKLSIHTFKTKVLPDLPIERRVDRPRGIKLATTLQGAKKCLMDLRQRCRRIEDQSFAERCNSAKPENRERIDSAMAELQKALEEVLGK